MRSQVSTKALFVPCNRVSTKALFVPQVHHLLLCVQCASWSMRHTDVGGTLASTHHEHCACLHAHTCIWYTHLHCAHELGLLTPHTPSPRHLSPQRVLPVLCKSQALPCTCSLGARKCVRKHNAAPACLCLPPETHKSHAHMHPPPPILPPNPPHSCTQTHTTHLPGDVLQRGREDLLL